MIDTKEVWSRLAKAIFDQAEDTLEIPVERILYYMSIRDCLDHYRKNDRKNLVIFLTNDKLSHLTTGMFKMEKDHNPEFAINGATGNVGKFMGVPIFTDGWFAYERRFLDGCYVAVLSDDDYEVLTGIPVERNYHV